MPSIEGEAHTRALLTKTKLAAVLRPQHVVTIKDSASVDQTLRVCARPCRLAPTPWPARCLFLLGLPASALTTAGLHA